VYLIYLTDRWGVDTYNILICSTEEQAESLVERYDKIKKRFNNLSEYDIQHRQDEIPKLADDLQISTYVLKAYLKEDYEIYAEEVNCIRVVGDKE